MGNYIIAYEQGYRNWYVSEFYKYFHSRLMENYKVKLTYMSLSELAVRFGKTLENNINSVFNWYNMVIMDESTEKMFIHSWYDYAPEIIKFSIDNNFNVVKFSCASNLTDDIIEKYKEKIIVQPSVYYLENWEDVNIIKSTQIQKNRTNKIYFNGLKYGIRENIMDALEKFDNFEIRTKQNSAHFREKADYYKELVLHIFGLSLNGAANICYRDLELFGLEVLNLRQSLKTKTYNPIVKDVHYLEFIDDGLVDKILGRCDVKDDIDEKLDRLTQFYYSEAYPQMINESKKWFTNNCLPENQYSIIVSFLEDFTILS